MAKLSSALSGTQFLYWRTRLFGRMLLAPELLIIAVLFAVALVFNRPPLLGIVITLIVGVLAFRIGTLYLAQHALLQSQYEHATQLAQLALWLNPWSADALALRGTLALVTGDTALAVDLLQQSVLRCPDAAATQAALSSALLAHGRAPAARLAAQRSVTIDPNCTGAYLYLAEAERACGATALEVEEWLRRGLVSVVRPDDEAALRCALSSLLYSEGRMAEAALVLGGVDRLIERCSPSSRGRLRLRFGELLLAQGQGERAHEYLRTTMLVPQQSAS